MAQNIKKTLFSLEIKKLSLKIKKLKGTKRVTRLTVDLVEKFSFYSIPLGLGLIIFFLILSLTLPKNRFFKAQERLVVNPNDFEAHLILAEEFLNHHQLQEAEKELHLVQENQSESQTPPETDSASLSKLWQKKQAADPQDIKWFISQWEKIIEQKSGYRDGYLHLALLHYKIFENEKARAYLEEALIIDPNHEPSLRLEKKLNKN